jgi:hypothetical protein
VLATIFSKDHGVFEAGDTGLLQSSLGLAVDEKALWLKPDAGCGFASDECKVIRDKTIA